MKRVFLLIILGFNFNYSQTNIKGNLTTLIGFPQFGFETSLGKKTTFQVDVLASLWQSVFQAPLKINSIFPEFRFYPKKKFEGFFVGGHIGGSKYHFQKWNYLNTDYVQKGYSLMYGITIGYVVVINDRFSLETFIGGGSQQGFYKGYLLSDGTRYDKAKNFNKSGELLIYRGGVMIVYKFKKRNEE